MQNTRRMIMALLASITVFYLWMLISVKMWPPPPPTTQPVSATQPAGTQPAATRPATTRPAGSVSDTQPDPAAVATTPAGGARVVGGDSTAPITLGSAAGGQPYPMQVHILPKGAVLQDAQIRGHYQTVDREAPYQVLGPMVLEDNYGRLLTYHSLATPRIRLEPAGIDLDLEAVVWRVAEQPPADASADAVLRAVLAVDVFDKNDAPLAVVTKTYELRPQPADPANQRTYDLSYALTVENRSQSPIEAIVTQQGPVGMSKEEPRSEDRRIIAAVWQDEQLQAKGYTRPDLIKTPDSLNASDQDQVADGQEYRQRIAWASESNKYFTCIMAPAGRTGSDTPLMFARLSAGPVTPHDSGHHEDLTYRFITRPMPIEPGQSTSLGFDCYIGPKSKDAFETVKVYTQRSYYTVISEGFYACAPAGLVGLMIALLGAFHHIPPHNYGLAIIILVLLVRGILHPVTKFGQVNMFKMQRQQAKLQPKIQALREKLANDKAKLNQEMMNLYRQEGINPAGTFLSCLPMMLQIPIWGALWTALATTIEMRHAPFDGWWIRDLAGPDALIAFSRPIDIPLLSLLMGPFHSINLLPILLGITQVLQTKFMPRGNTQASATGNPDQLEQQRKMMMFMSVFFVFLLYNAPSGLNLYIMASNLFGIIEQWRIRQHLAEAEKRHEELERQRLANPQPAKKSWFMEKWSELSKRADEARKVESARKKSGGKKI